MNFSLKQARMFADKTQQEMADSLKIHRSTYIKLEEHPESVTISQAKRISQITGIPVDQIFLIHSLLLVDCKGMPMDKSLVFLEPNRLDAVPFTTSEVIAEFADVKRHAVQSLIQKHESDFAEFGRVAFEMRPLQTKGGVQEVKVYLLNEEQATLLMTYLKNTERVRTFKKELVRQFYAMRTELLNRKDRRAELKPIRRELTDVVKEVGGGRWAYKQYTDLAYKSTLGLNAAQLRKQRNAPKKATAVDYMTADEIAAVTKRQGQFAVLIEMGLSYQQIKALAQDGA